MLNLFFIVNEWQQIQISMTSKGTKCIRSYVPSSFGLSTSNTIKLSIALNSKASSSSILFIQGENSKFMAIEMVKRKIRFVWNLGGETTSITHPMEIQPKEPKYDDAWYYIEANRTMNLGSLIVRQDGNANDAFNSNSQKYLTPVSGASGIEFTRFVVIPSDRIWIGGIPHDIRPKELYDTENGLEMVLNRLYINEKQIGLWHYVYQEGDCSGAVQAPHESSTSSASVRHFNGDGYAVVSKQRTKPYRKNFFALQMSFKTLDENALLFLAVDEKNVSLPCTTRKHSFIFFKHFLLAR